MQNENHRPIGPHRFTGAGWLVRISKADCAFLQLLNRNGPGS
jgi:hypothetical protein